MQQTQRQAAMGFSDERFPVGTHMCLIYDDENERVTSRQVCRLGFPLALTG